METASRKTVEIIDARQKALLDVWTAIESNRLTPLLTVNYNYSSEKDCGRLLMFVESMLAEGWHYYVRDYDAGTSKYVSVDLMKDGMTLALEIPPRVAWAIRKPDEETIEL